MHFTVANIRADDRLQRAQGDAFLLDNPDPGVRARPVDQLNRAIETGQALLVTESSTICAISLVYQFDPGLGWPVFYEIGTMRVTAQGYRLQAFLAQLHLVQVFLEDDATRGPIFAVVSPDTPSAHNLSAHVGMQPFEPPDLLRLLRAEAGVPFDPAKQVLIADEATIARAFAALRALHRGDRRFGSPKGGGEIEIAMGWFDPSLLDCGP